MSDHNKQGNCWRCGYSLQQTAYRHESLCPGCRTPTRVCRNCRFFKNSAPKQCNEPKADLVINKQRANQCEYFAV